MSMIRRTTRLPGCCWKPCTRRCEERIASTQPMPVKTSPTRPTMPIGRPVVCTPATASSTFSMSRNGRFSVRKLTTAWLTSPLLSTKPKTA